MKKLFFATTIIFWSSMLFSQQLQIPQDPNANFYDMLDDFYSQDLNPDPAEGAIEEQVERMDHIWSERLFPYGDCRIAAEAMVEYASDYSQTMGNGYDPNWIELGPVGSPILAPENGNQTPDDIGSGQIHRITFDPDYTGNLNKTIYICSSYGGLWRTENNGNEWENVNTDIGIPYSSVADVAVAYGNSNYLFISTGEADGGIANDFDPNWSKTNPINTIGVFRSLDRGETWEEINSGFMEEFEDQNYVGTTRKIMINPIDDNQLFVATTEGIMRCNNALVTIPTWERVFDGSEIYSDVDREFRGLAFKPGSPETIYASGKDIYKSDNNGDPNTWVSLTGNGTGLDLSNIPDNFRVKRINIAVTDDDHDVLYAYLFGTEEFMNNNEIQIRDRIYIYKLDDGIWVKRYSYIASDGNYSSISWLSIAVNPNDEDEFYFGLSNVQGTDPNVMSDGPDADNYSDIHNVSYYGEYLAFHADVHALAFPPTTALNQNLYCGNHGGFSIMALPCSYNGFNAPGFEWVGDWEQKNIGLAVGIIWSFDDSERSRNRIITGHQDCGINYKSGEANTSWFHLEYGDGYGAQISDENEDVMFYISGETFLGYETSDEYSLLPDDPEGGVTNVPKTFQIKNKSDNDKMYFGFNELYRREMDIPDSDPTPEEIWTLISDIHKTEPLGWKRQITEFSFCKNIPLQVYVVTGGETGLVNPHLFRSTNPNCDVYDDNVICYEDITGNIPLGALSVVPVITGIAVHPTNPDKFWITFTGYEEDYRVWYSDYGGDNFYNADPNNTLPRLPVNAIAYQEGTDDRLYIGTDVGVYVLNTVTGDWEKYGDFPNVRVHELKINSCLGKLRVATFGRGVWEGDLLPPDYLGYPYEATELIDQDETWTDPKVMHSNLTINTGATLTIENDVYMPFDGKIFVKRGGKLIVDGGKITNECDAMWGGVILYGNSDLEHPDVSEVLNGNYPASSEDHAVIFLKNGGILENAANAITTAGQNTDFGFNMDYSGGIVVAENSTFRNNKRDVAFMSFTESRDISYFSNCTFERNQDYRLDADETFAHITMWDVHGVSFRGCEFVTNDPEMDLTVNGSSTLLPQLGEGIYSLDADYTVTTEGSVPTEFTQLARGITAHFTPDFFSNTVYGNLLVEGSNFIDVQRGMHLMGATSPVVIYNNFSFDKLFFGSMADYVVITHGIYLEGCNSYTVEENHLAASNVTQHTENAVFSWGIVVHNGHANNEMIYRNECHNLMGGIIPLGLNGISTTTVKKGLTMKCNTFTGNNADISVRHGNDINNIFLGIGVMQNTQPRVHPLQGRCLPFNLDQFGQAPANNLFSINAANSFFGEWHIWAHAQTNNFRYAYAQFCTNCQPVNSKTSLNIVTKQMCPGIFMGSQSCPTLVQMTGGQMRSFIQERDGDQESLDAQMLSLDLESDQQKLDLQLATAANIDAVYDILQQEEIVKPEVLDQAIAHYAACYDLQGLKDALISKSGLADETVEELLMAQLPYTQNDIDEIQAAQNQVSPYEQFLQSVVQNKTDREIYTRKLANYYLSVQERDSLIEFLEKDTFRYSKELLLNLSLGTNNESGLNALLDDVYPIGNCDECRDYWEWKIDKTVSDEIPDLNDVSVLKTIASTENPVAAYAIAELEFITGERYQEIYPEVDSFSQRVNGNEENPWDLMRVVEDNVLNINPNPTSGTVMISWDIEHDGNFELRVQSDLGVEVFSRYLISTENIVTLNVEGWQKGLYLVSLKRGNEIIATGKLSVQ